ncbi:hypothetical protein [Tenacibaculum caenipelagi]|uniref:Uncharacterized protein n=1 Tax=Tenacibaculum caenipelagi TaxID=1325435 RepID=A0A4R6TI68_9FLAO|nr:hypothetical protein [Tenacibaculum caenipelagi]TDQ28412.1 hypothetical protein DFQ07_0782 [Tenacibaculum caenipelagi]
MFRKLLRQDLIFLILILSYIILKFSRSNEDYLHENLDKEGVRSVALMTDISSVKTRTYVHYKYSVGGKIYNGSQKIQENSLLPEKLGFYPILYSLEKNNVSKLLLTEKPLNPKKFINDGVYVNGKITKVLEGHYPALDFYISYNFNNQDFSFRTRLHKDSINCSILEDCKNKKIIRIKVSKEYPFFNDLYFKSSDRQRKNINS